jgi:uncharacterized membrane protein
MPTVAPFSAAEPAERLLAFSDGVVAIAITLLVLPLVELVPESAGEYASALELLRDHAVQLGGFLLGFLVIWRIWRVHHRVFAATTTVSGLVARLNMVWLAAVVLLPFPVALVGAFGAEPFVLALYVGLLLASSLALTAMAVLLRSAAVHAGRAAAGSVPETRVLQQVVGNAIGLGVAFAVVIVFPAAGFWPLLLLFADAPVIAVIDRMRRVRSLRGGTP